MFKLIKKGEIEYYISDLFPENVNHAFTTRKGGFAPPPLDNFSMGTAQFNESYEFIQKNRELLCSMLNINYENLVKTDQHHTDTIVLLRNKNQADKEGWLPSTDGIITNKKDFPCMLFFADCTPIMLYDTEHKVLGLVHAGWKGTAKKIVFKTVKKMIRNFKSKPENILAAIGPNIGMCCYEVRQDVVDQLLDTVSENFDKDIFVTYRNDKPYVNLKEINAAQLKDCGLSQIDVSTECTACNQEIFFSHRATGGKTGRQVLVAQLS